MEAELSAAQLSLDKDTVHCFPGSGSLPTKHDVFPQLHGAN